MVQSLHNYSAPHLIYESIKQLGITLEFCTVERVHELLTFIQHEVPSWVRFYERIITLGDRQDCLLAVDKRQTIVAALNLYGPWSHPSRTDTVWQAVFGQNLGALGVVITASLHRRLGIGSVLVGYATEVLKARGASHSFIGWTWAEDFYRKLGYEVWQTYKMSWRVSQANPSSLQT